MPGITNPAEEYFKDGLWGWVTDQWKKLVATAGGALHIQFAGQEADVEVTQTAAADLTPGICGWDGSAWRKLPLVWGYYDRIAGTASTVSTGATETLAVSGNVDANEVWVVQGLLCMHNEDADRGMYLGPRAGATTIQLARSQAAGLYVPLTVHCELVLKEGDSVHGGVSYLTSGRTVFLRWWGYKMKIAE